MTATETAKRTPVNRAALRRFAKKHGCTLEFEIYPDDTFGELISPKGKIFGDNVLHTLCWTEYPGVPVDYSEEIESILSLEDCTDPDCEWCHPSDEAN
ncbi:MAG TPA: hypothetical protein VL017_08675 [Devosia sp.]|nr:hypothetical protein [Devosia sp.]